jgi:hypothetical protein
MPSPPPFDKITTIPAIAMSQLTIQFDSITESLVSRALNCVQDVIKLPESVKCSNPSIDRIKNKLRLILNTINNLIQSMPLISTLASIFQTIGSIASVALTFLIISPIPIPPAGIPVIQAQSELISNVLSAIKTLRILLKSIQSILVLVVSKLNFIFSFLISKCGAGALQGTDAGSLQDLPDVGINVTVKRDISISDDPFEELSCFLKGVEEKFSSVITPEINYNTLISDDFYTNSSVTENTLVERNNNIRELLDLQLNVLETLKQSPSKLLTGIGVPLSSVGFVGDYFIDIQNNVIYGPKPSDNEWNNGIIIPS